MSTSGEYPPVRQCFNQYCPSSFDLKVAQFSDSTILLCGTCYELYKRRKCCYFCAQVYKDDEQNFLDGKKWVQCDNQRCGKWTHIDCEVSDIESQLQHKSFKYKCPWCRIEKDKKKKQSQPTKSIINQDQADQSDQDPEYIHSLTKKASLEESSIQQNYEPWLKKNTFLEELLKKNGEFTQCINQEELQSDLIKMRTLLKK
ncbi:unnamed protein product [Paramecium pentaurelia]|uniref:PHD-type domain-containing protein n=1 Tax=Paramecium pentaurelia TaxID=43138 RepID=A0A8S1T2H2_9CILI|nr:unnamed protein product [Paramecium pentaurelia]